LLGFLLLLQIRQVLRRRSATQEGIWFGVLVAIMLISFAAVWSLVVLPISGSLAAALTIDYVLECSAYGMC